MIFSKRTLEHRVNFYHTNKQVEIVKNFKYLGIVISFNGQNIKVCGTNSEVGSYKYKFGSRKNKFGSRKYEFESR